MIAYLLYHVKWMDTCWIIETIAVVIPFDFLQNKKTAVRNA